MAAIFADQARLQGWLEIELLAVEGWAQTGEVPADAAVALRRNLGSRIVDMERVAELEAEQGHDVAAFVSALQEVAGEPGRFLHLGLTSSDVVDTALAVQLAEAGRLLLDDASELERALAEQAVAHRLTVMVGRTHGVHAEPITLGVKLANHLDELRRSRERLAAALREVAVGRLSGPVGTHSSVPPAVEEHVCRALGLEVAPATTQVVARDRHAALICAMALAGAVLERLATALRLAQQTEVGELEEPFARRQKGSSAMPHKRNPVLSERVCGLARVLRGHCVTALENVALWHERDISHSSAERIVLPDSFALLDYMLQLSARVVSGLRVDAERMRANLDWCGGIVFSQRVLNALVIEAGWPRERAYRAVQELAFAALEGQAGFTDLVGRSAAVAGALREAGVRLEDCFDTGVYTARVRDTFVRLGLPWGEGTRSSSSAGPALPEATPEVAVEAGLGGGQS